MVIWLTASKSARVTCKSGDAEQEVAGTSRCSQVACHRHRVGAFVGAVAKVGRTGLSSGRMRLFDG